MNCPECEKELYQRDPGIDTLQDEDEAEESFIAIEYLCENKKCKHYNKKMTMFFDYTRTEVEGETIHENIIGK